MYATTMAALQRLCLVVDIDGFFFKRLPGSQTPPPRFLVREWDGAIGGKDCSSYHYGYTHLYHQLSLMDRRTVQHVRSRDPSLIDWMDGQVGSTHFGRFSVRLTLRFLPHHPSKPFLSGLCHYPFHLPLF